MLARGRGLLAVASILENVLERKLALGEETGGNSLNCGDPFSWFFSALVSYGHALFKSLSGLSDPLFFGMPLYNSLFSLYFLAPV